MGIARALMQRARACCWPTSRPPRWIPKTSVEIMSPAARAGPRARHSGAGQHARRRARRRFADRIVGMSGGHVVYDGDGAGLSDDMLKTHLRRRGLAAMSTPTTGGTSAAPVCAGNPARAWPGLAAGGLHRSTRCRSSISPGSGSRGAGQRRALHRHACSRPTSGKLGHRWPRAWSRAWRSPCWPPRWASLLALPIGLLGARNLMPAWVTWPARALIAVCRSLHPVIVAIIFVKAVGFGALAGMLALTVGIDRLHRQAVRRGDRGDLAQAGGGGARHRRPFMNVVAFGVLPQVFSRFVGFATYQLDSNLRNSTMVGIVGAGGIGGALFSAFQRFDYDFVFAILLVHHRDHHGRRAGSPAHLRQALDV
ncbi:MAG: hypothetical protein QM805_05530 [Pseudomonas sp.]